MGVHFVALTLLAIAQAPDTATYRDAATAALIDQARQRHEYQDQLVRDYSALVRTRIDVGFGRSRFARIPPVVAHETAARITWALPNDLKVDVVGERYASAISEAEINAQFDRPWFIPRSLGDSIRLVDDELPATAALHPLAAGAERYYRFAIVDSLTMEIPGRTVRAVAVRVEPKVLGPSLIAGDLWVDIDTAELVRLMFVFVGEYLWDTPSEGSASDSAEVRKGNLWASRILKVEADLEYALFDARYWMPYRQLLQLSINIPWFMNLSIPVRFLTTFDDYAVNTSVLPVFEVAPLDPDAVEDEEEDFIEIDIDESRAEPRRRARTQTRCPDSAEECDREVTGYFRVGESERGGRWEVHYPPDDSLLAFTWPDELALSLEPEDEARIHETIGALGAIQEQMPADWVGRMQYGVAFETFADLYRFNRVQGTSLGFGYQFRPGPDFTSVVAIGRFGLGDKRPTGSLTWRRDAPGGRLDITAFRAVREAEPWTRGSGFGNSLNAAFTAHDDADYHLALGGGFSFRSNGAGLLRDAEIAVYFERQESMLTESSSGLNDLLGGSGVFDPNPAVADGDYVRTSFSRRSLFGRVTFWQGADVLRDVSDEDFAARVWGSLEIPFAVLNRTGALTLRGGAATGDELPQMGFRVGGPQTVRGYGYGYKRGMTFWSAQLDLGLRPSAAVSPVVFADVGDAYRAIAGAVPSVAEGPLVSVGAGLSLLEGFMRFNIAKGLNPDEDLRFDLLFQAPR